MKKTELKLITIFLVVCITMFFRDVLFNTQTYFARDLTFLFQPWRTYAAEIIQSGKIPLWNPYSYGGMPFLANLQSAIFYPFSILFYLFSFVPGLKLFYFIHFFITTFFAYLVIKKFTGLTTASLIGAIIWGFSGCLVTKLEFLSILGCAVWLPAVLLMYPLPIMLALTCAISFLGGYPEYFVGQMAILLIYGLFYSKLRMNPLPSCPERSQRMGERIRVRGLLIGLGLFVLLIAVQLIPTIELYSLSYRQAEKLSYDIASTNSLPLSGILGFIFPVSKLFVSDVAPFTGEKFYWVTTLYFGILSSVLIGLSWLTKNKKLVSGLFLLFIFTIFFALGKNTPVYNFLYHYIPFFNLVRYPAKVLYIASFIGTILVVIGYRTVSEKFSLSWKIKSVLNLFIVTELLVYGTHLYPTINENYFQHNITAKTIQKLAPDNRLLVTPKTRTQAVFQAENVARAWQLVREYLPNAVSLPYHIFAVSGYGEPLTINWNEKFTSRIFSIPKIKNAIPWLKFMNVGTVISNDKISEKDFQILKQKQGLLVPLYMLKNSLPRAFLYPDAKVVDVKESWSEINKPDFNPTRELFLISDGCHPELVSGSKSFIRHSEERSDKESQTPQILKYTPESIEIKANISSPLKGKPTDNINNGRGKNWLILTDTYYPGWQAYVHPDSVLKLNSKKIPIFRANYSFRAISVPAGENKIFFHYQPITFTIGIWLTIIGLFICVLKGIMIIVRIPAQPESRTG